MNFLTSMGRPSMTRVIEAEMQRRRESLRSLGFLPAYYDHATCTLYPSRHCDGRPAQDHVLDGLPDEVVVVRSDCGRVIAIKATLVAGFERNGFFYTRDAAWNASHEWVCAGP